jgi:hypothetical protein
MAKFPNITMTSAGLEMLARAASGQTADRFIVTKVKLGDGVSEGNIRDYTDVISPKKEVTLAAYEDKGNGTFRYTFTYNNEGVKVGFYHREIGLFAKNGDSGTEKLVGYTNAGNYAGYIDDETRIQPYTRLIINVGIGDTDNASGIVDVGNTVTIEMLDEHNNDENAHTNLIKRLFGSATATMDSVKNSVQGWCKESIASIFGIASATQTNVKNKILEYAQEQIESWLETLGIRYNIAQNGYICLGKLFGDAIIQWGLLILKKDHTQEPDSNFVQETLDLPISLKIAACGMSTSNVLINTYCYIHSTLPTLTIGRNPYNTDTKHYYLIVGK